MFWNQILRKDSISTRLIIRILVFSFFITLAITCAQLYFEYRREIGEIEKTFNRIETSFLPAITDSAWVANRRQLQTQLNGALQLRDLRYLEVREDDEILARAGELSEAMTRTRRYPLLYRYNERLRQIGTLSVTASLQGVYARMEDRVLTILATQGIKTLLVVGFMFFLFQNFVTRHLATIADYTRNFRLDDPFYPLKLSRIGLKSGRDELDEVVDSINGTSLKLREFYASLDEELVRRQRAEKRLQRANEEMELRVKEATTELRRTNENLLQEIEERKTTEEKLKVAIGELDGFVRTVSHDLRSPLSPIIGGTGYLREFYADALDAEALSFIEDMEASARRMLALLEDLLALAKVGHLERPGEPVSVTEVIAQVLQDFGSAIIESGTRVSVVEGLPQIRIPESLLRQIFTNLIGNALRYAGGEGRAIEIGGLRDGRLVTLHVRDHGPGIPVDEREKIFEVFSRGSTGEDLPGTGVGLATVKKIARLYDGRAWVEETPGGGSTFFVELRDQSEPVPADRHAHIPALAE